MRSALLVRPYLEGSVCTVCDVVYAVRYFGSSGPYFSSRVSVVEPRGVTGVS